MFQYKMSIFSGQFPQNKNDLIDITLKHNNLATQKPNVSQIIAEQDKPNLVYFV